MTRAFKTYNLYVNGTLRDSKTSSQRINLTSGDLFKIGEPICQTDKRYKGDIDELRIYKKALSHDEIEAGLFKPEIAMLHPTVMLRRSAVCALGGYRADFPHVEDLDLFLRLGEVGRLANLPDVLLEYRMHLSNVSHQHTVAQSQAALRAVDEARCRRGLDPGFFPATSALSTAAETRAQLHRKWAWWALGAGNVRTARKHATRAMMAEPWSWQNLRVLACALRGSFKARA